MKLESLREEVLEANLELVRRGLALYTFGNASGRDRASGLVAIKPSGVPYERLRPADLVVVDLEGRLVEGALRPSSDLPTHLALYRAFPALGGVAHTHSRAATAFAQARREIPCLGTTHADYFHGPVPVTRLLTADEVAGDYEARTGQAIVERLAGADPLGTPGVLVAAHGPFTWGPTARAAAHHAVILEELAEIALRTLALDPAALPIPAYLRDKHFFRKHGPGAYYGQPGEEKP
jgi:L-ribulose-5-phosphate 4-epimerase